MPEHEIGKFTHYFAHVSVGVIDLTEGLKVGDTIHVKGAHDDFTQAVESMQVDHKDVAEAKTGDQVGLKVAARVHPHDRVFKVA
ncbi:MAG: translation elongation factor-like protein [Elusimicrobia bacterium]|nr:translation elongation factor-like protein [Elusimicrobiota bacterium]